MIIRLLFIFLFFTSIAFGQSLDVDNVYTFSPSKLTKAEQEKKLPALDDLWHKVKSDTAANLPFLRKELETPNHNPFFYYDGAVLLLSLSNNEGDKKIAANAIAKCDVSDIDSKEYVMTLNNLSNDGINVTNAAVHILNDTVYSFFLPQHAMYFEQGDCLVYMLLPEKKEFYTDTLIALFKSVNPNSQKAILYTLWFSFSCRGDSLINEVINDKSLNKAVSTYAKGLLKAADVSHEITEQIKTLEPNQIESLRKEALKRFSDEALGELMVGTLALRKHTHCL